MAYAIWKAFSVVKITPQKNDFIALSGYIKIYIPFFVPNHNYKIDFDLNQAIQT